MFECTSIVNSTSASNEAITWREVDNTLRSIAKRRSALDADEARWLREACRLEIWRQLCFVSALDYCDRILGQAPRTAQERLRVAKALGELPQIEAALQRGDLSFSAVREVTRVATPQNDELWCQAAMGLSLRDVEELVSMHERGDKPTDPAKPIVKDHNVALTLPPEIYAMYRQGQSPPPAGGGRAPGEAEPLGTVCPGHPRPGPPTG